MMESLTGIVLLVGVLLALLETLSLVLWLLGVGSVALVACLVDGSVTDTGVSRHVDGKFGEGGRFVGASGL